MTAEERSQTPFSLYESGPWGGCAPQLGPTPLAGRIPSPRLVAQLREVLTPLGAYSCNPVVLAACCEEESRPWLLQLHLDAWRQSLEGASLLKFRVGFSFSVLDSDLGLKLGTDWVSNGFGIGPGLNGFSGPERPHKQKAATFWCQGPRKHGFQKWAAASLAEEKSNLVRAAHP